MDYHIIQSMFNVNVKRNTKKLTAFLCLGSILASSFSPIVTEAAPDNGVTPVSWMEYDEYDKPVLMTDEDGNGEGTPFFFNGVQIRDDKIRDRYHYSDEDMGKIYQQAADDGFTMANSQILWSMIQPDQNKDSISGTYIKSGSNSDTSYGDFSSKDDTPKSPDDVEKVSVFYDPVNQENNAVTYLQYDFSDIEGDSEEGYAATKIRLYVSGLTGAADICGLHVYGIKNDSWDATTMTWNTAPVKLNADGTLTGDEGTDFVDIGSTEHYDPVNASGYYDIDVTDFVNTCYKENGKKASFLIAADPAEDEAGNEVTSGVDITLDNDNNWVYFPDKEGQEDKVGAYADYTYPFAPILTISRTTFYDYTWVDKVVDWADAADLKLEFLWFGTDTTKISADGRLPYYVIRNYQKSFRDAANPDAIVGEKTPDDKKYPGTYRSEWLWWFLMCKNDSNLQEKEYNALKSLYDHIAEDSQVRGKRVVFGCDISNESATTIRSGSGRCQCDYCNDIWQNGDGIISTQKYKSQGIFNYDSYWRWTQNLGKAVKDSKYPVWTRINQHTNRSDYVYRNENAKANGDVTYVDFVGYDPYISSVDEALRYGTGLYPDTKYDQYNYGNNLPMVMETSGTQKKSDFLNIATIAGGSTYNIYNMLARDGNDLYINRTDDDGNDYYVNANSNIENIRQTNHWLNTMWNALATMQPENAGGSKLIFFNEWANGKADIDKYVGGINVNYSTDAQGVGIAVEESDTSFVLASKHAATFTLRQLGPYSVTGLELGYFDVNNQWVKTGDKEYAAEGNDILIQMGDYETARLTVQTPIPDMEKVYAVKEDFEDISFTDNWNIETGAATIDVYDKPGMLDRSARINKTSTEQEKSGISKDFDSLSGKVIVRSMVYFKPGGPQCSAPIVYDSNGKKAAEILFDSDWVIKYVGTDGGSTSLGGYEGRCWYQIELRIDTEMDTCDVYVQGKKIQANLPLLNEIDDIAKVEFCEEGTTAVTMYVNDAQVYQEAGLRVLSSLQIKEPEKKEYQAGEELDLSGMTVIAKYSDGSENVLADGKYTISGFDSKKTGEQKLTVSYSEAEVVMEAYFIVMVKETVKEADRTFLDISMRMAENILNSGIILNTESQTALESALASAKELSAEPAQKEVDEAVQVLLTAVQEAKTGITRIGLKAAIDVAEEFLADIDTIGDITEESIQALTDALGHAKDCYNNTALTQEEANEATNLLIDAIAKVESIDRSRLLKAIAYAKELLNAANLYTDESIAVLREAVNIGKTVAENQDATKEEIEKAIRTILEDIANLKIKVDKSELSNAIEKAESILGEEYRYIKSTLVGITAQLSTAKHAFSSEGSTQEEINGEAVALVKELMNVRLLGDVSGKGEVGTESARIVLSYISELEELDNLQMEAADTNRNQEIDTDDAVKILQYEAEMIDSF